MTTSLVPRRRPVDPKSARCLQSWTSHAPMTSREVTLAGFCWLFAWHRAWCLHPAGGRVMKAFLATVLSVIAAGVLLIAYAVLTQRGPTAGFPDARPIVASQRLGLVDDGYAA